LQSKAAVISLLFLLLAECQGMSKFFSRTSLDYWQITIPITA